MYIKKSLLQATAQATALSTLHPEIIYYVLDKRHKSAAVHTSEWVVKEKILEGWHTVAKYMNGVKIA
ncbi:MAG: hypothetical protein IJR45_00365 [Firmicutes bacterium]|nr:hypothetical protein [Bacillota bacterium]